MSRHSSIKKSLLQSLSNVSLLSGGRKQHKSAARSRRGSYQLERLEAREMLDGSTVISELMAINTTTLQDEDADYSDWVELENRGDLPSDLSGYFLTDDSGNLSKWQIPAGTNLGAGEFLTVFASGKDRGGAGAELHTNFTLDEAGGYLALVEADGLTIVTEFDTFPALGADQSYGSVRASAGVNYINDTTPTNILIPADGSLGNSWNGGSEPFDDSVGAGWTQGTGAVGFDVSDLANFFDVTMYYSSITVANLAGSDNAIAGNNLRSAPVSAQTQVINFVDTGGSGNFGGDLRFPGESGGNDDNFVMRATTTFFIRSDEAGDWTFGFNSDDGGRLRIDGADVIVDDTNHGPEDRLGTVTLAAGQHTLEYVMWEQALGAEAELFAAPGTFGGFDASMTLMGDPNGTLPLRSLDELVDTDIQAQMFSVNASAYLRFPFTVDDASVVESLNLEIEYEEGYVLFLNGTQIDAENAPASPAFDSGSAAAGGLAKKVLDLSSQIGLLTTGVNILAVQGLNETAGDDEFLIDVTLSGRGLSLESLETFNVPTPGLQNGLLAPLITEFMASNSNVLDDEDGDSSDWIEIHNPGQIDIDLAGYFLTDEYELNPETLERIAPLQKWAFPSTTLAAGEYLLVFASGKDRATFGSELHTNFRLSADGDYLGLLDPAGNPLWEYEIGGLPFDPQTLDVSFGLRGISSNVPSGPNRVLGTDAAGFTVRQVGASSTFPGTVTGEIGGGGAAADPLADADALLALPGGDGGIANDVTVSDVASINFRDSAGGGSNGLFGSDEPFPRDIFEVDENQFAIRATATLVVPAGEAGNFILGTNSDEGVRLRIDGTDVILDNQLHSPVTRTGTITLGEGTHTLELVYFERVGGAALELFYASSSDGVTADGDFELLTQATLAELPDVPPSIYDAPRVFFDDKTIGIEPTPGEPNNAGAVDFVAPTELSVPRGWYSEPFSLTLSNSTPDVAIYYTLNGTDPLPSNPAAILYDGNPLTISQITTLRASGFKEGAAVSKTTSVTYLFLSDVLQQNADTAVAAGFPEVSPTGQSLQYGLDQAVLTDPRWSGRVDDAFMQIPSMSMVVDINDLFGDSNGIYVNAGNRGQAWERPMSLEMIVPDGYVDPFAGEAVDEFQVNGGVRIRGGFSRVADNPKHAFRFFFRGEYGDTKLETSLFGSEGTDKFDKIDLRTPQNYSWAFDNGNSNGNGNNIFLRDIVSRDMQGVLGSQYSKGRYYHLFINGQYWGIYQTDERPEARFAASYFGGDSEDYDVVKNDPYSVGATDGTLDAYQRFFDRFRTGVGDDNMANYLALQGLDADRNPVPFRNPDGSKNLDFERVLNVENLQDYMIITYYTSDADGPGSVFSRPGLNNWFAIYNREDPDGFQHFEHDSEHSFDTGGAGGANFNMVQPFLSNCGSFGTFNPQCQHEVLMETNSDYRQQFIDRVTEVLTGDGILSTDNVLALIDNRASQIDDAIIAQSARWGNTGNQSETQWISTVSAMRDFVINGRPDDFGTPTPLERGLQVIEQFKTAGWWSAVDAPTFTPEGGFLDNAETTPISLGIPTATTFTEEPLWTSSFVYYTIPTDNLQDATFMERTFSTTGWSFGRQGLGYETGTGYETFISTTLPDATTSVYVRNRTAFSADPDFNGVADDFDDLVLKVRYDDGFIAYLNGVEIARANAPAGPAAFDSVATVLNDATAAVEFQEFPIDLSALPEGTLLPSGNRLAFQALNVSDTSSGFLFHAQLFGRTLEESSASTAQIYYTLDGTDPRGSGGDPSASAIAYNTLVDFVLEGDSGKFLVPTSDIGTTWTGAGFNDTAWTDATTGIGYDTGEAEIVGGFSMRVVDTTVGDVATLDIAQNILNGNTAGFTIGSDVTQEQPYINHGDAGDLGVLAVLPFFGTPDREQFAVRATATVTIPVGTYTIDVGSDDGASITIPGVSFSSSYNQNGGSPVGSDTIRYNVPRTHGHTGGTFTVSGIPLVTTINVDFFELDRGNSVEVSLANGALGGFNAGSFSILENGTLGWGVNTPGQNVDYSPRIATDIQAAMNGVNSSAYLRMPFSVANAADLKSLTLDISYEDGFVAYLNGTQVASLNAPDAPFAFDSTSLDAHSDFDAFKSEFIDLTGFLDLLVEGADNVLAIQLLNSSNTDPDALLIPVLTGTYVGEPFLLTENSLIIARAFTGGQWSPKSSEFYILGSTELTISEINYHPADPTQAEIDALALVLPDPDDNDFEFIELTNTSDQPVSTAGIRFTEGIEFDFLSMSSVSEVAPGERIVLVRNRDAFEARYGAGAATIAGVYNLGLSNSGEQLTTVDGTGAIIQQFSYNDNWYPITDGDGFSLVVRDLDADLANWGNRSNWRPSDLSGGTPGMGDLFTTPIPGEFIVNEILTSTTDPLGTRIELFNSSADPADISGWFLSDDPADVMKFQLPATPPIPAGGYYVLSETDDFGGAFALSNTGGVIILQAAGSSGALSGFTIERGYGASDAEVTYGEYVKSTGSTDFVALTAATFGGPNAGPVIGPIVINEIHYNPAIGGDEFIELKNISDAPVDLDGWQFIDGVSFVFPAITMQPGQLVVVAGVDEATFRANSDVPSFVTVLGPYGGVLDNAGEDVELGKSGPSGSLIEVDRVVYDDKAPWPVLPDGSGPSLSKLVSATFGNDPVNWGSGIKDGTPGSENRLVDLSPPTVPESVNAQIIAAGEIVVGWYESTDLESGIDEYRIYRNGLAIGTSPIAFYIDTIPIISTAPITYQVTAINGDGVETPLSLESPAIALSSIRLQDGTDGYLGTRDATIREASADVNDGLAVTIEADAEDDAGLNLRKRILIRWETSPVAAGSVVFGVSIALNVIDVTGDGYPVFAANQDWVETEVTWNRASTALAWATPGAGGVPADHDPTELARLGFGSLGLNTATFNAAGVSVLQQWVDGTRANFGFVVDDGGQADGLDTNSREFATVTSRPALNVLIAPPPNALTGDFNLDGSVDVRDIDLQNAAIALGSTAAVFDLDGFNGVNADDVVVLVEDIIGTRAGDNDLNGKVDRSDAVRSLFGFGGSGVSRWSLGDSNGDGKRGLADLGLLQSNFGFVAPASSAAASSVVTAVASDIAAAVDAARLTSVETADRTQPLRSRRLRAAATDRALDTSALRRTAPLASRSTPAMALRSRRMTSQSSDAAMGELDLADSLGSTGRLRRSAI